MEAPLLLAGFFLVGTTSMAEDLEEADVAEGEGLTAPGLVG